MFSIIIPTYNRQAALRRTLKSIISLEHDKDIEIIVVNDDPSSAVAVLDDSRIRVINNSENMGRSRSRNAGAAASAGEFLFFIDDDVEVREDIFKKYREMLTSGFDAIFSNVINVRTDGKYSLLNDFLNTRGANRNDFETNFRSNYFTTAFCAVKKVFFEKAGGFDENFEGYGWEDPELGLRIEKYSGKIGFIRTGSLVHYHDKDVDEWVSQLENSGKNLQYLIGKHPHFKKLIHYNLLTSVIGALVFNPVFYAVEKHKAKKLKGFFGHISLRFLFYAAIRRALIRNLT
jgi:GT2 family glycosyltransferase